MIADLEKTKNINTARNPAFWNPLVINGIIEGSWKRIIKKDLMEINIEIVRSLSEIEMNALEIATNKFGNFWGMKVKLIL